MEGKTQINEERAKGILKKIVKFMLSLQRPTESSFSIALIPKPIGKTGQKIDADYAFLMRTHETQNREEKFFIDFLKKSIFPMLQEFVAELVSIIETTVKYDAYEWTCYYLKFQDPQWRRNLERKIQSL